MRRPRRDLHYVRGLTPGPAEETLHAVRRCRVECIDVVVCLGNKRVTRSNKGKERGPEESGKWKNNTPEVVMVRQKK
jgi:hypothetical protein